MIYGCIPVGGKGTRLGLPFSKEMLPLVGYDHYKPVIEHTTSNMINANCDKIVFVHGEQYKTDIVKYFDNENYLHILQQKSSPFVINDFLKFFNEGIMLYGLPDTVYYGNPFIESLNYNGNIACIFETNDQELKVDRLNNDHKFDIKSIKLDTNSNKFWGAAKLEIKTLPLDFVGNEVGDFLNYIGVDYTYNSFYEDLGTWKGYKSYISNYRKFL